MCKLRHIKRAGSIALAASLSPTASWAQPPQHAAEDSAEIIVTGERIGRSIRETASSVVVADDNDIAQRAAVDRVEQLLALVPNVQLGSGGDGPAIRGQDTTGVLRDLPAFLGGNRPRVTVQVDGRAIGYNEFAFGTAPLWDVEQVEIFRSPQTTTQGRNSIAGAIFVRSKDPTYSWEGGARLIAGNYATRQASVVVSGPIAADQLAVRIAGDIRRSRVSSDIGGTIVGADPNRDDYDLVRVKWLAEPDAIPGARIELTYSHTRSQAPQIVSVREPFRQRGDAQAAFGVFKTRVDSLTSMLDYQIGRALTSTTTASYGDAYIRRFAPAGLGQSRIKGTDFSLESILRWQSGDGGRIIGGVSVVSAELEQSIDLSAALLGKGDFTDRQKGLGLFGEATFDPLPRLTVTAGLRYQRDGQDREGALGRFATDYDRSFSAWLPKASIAYAFAPDASAGVLVQRAFNPGGTTINLDTGGPEDFEAETLWNYELFLRSTLADGRVTLAANLFYNDMTSAQRAQQRSLRVPGGPTAFWALIDNVPSAESYGAEAELSWRASQRLLVRGGLGLLKTRILETTSPNDPILGKQFQRAPKLTASVAFDWHASDAWRLSTQLRHNSGYFSDDANTLARRIGGATVVDARLTYARGGFSVFAYARNAFDSFYLTFLNSAVSGVAGDPREAGIGVEARF